MGVRLPSVASTTIIASVPASGTETVIITTPPINLSLDFAQVLLFWYLLQTIGAGTTSITLRIRRGTSAASALVNVPSIQQVTAGNNAHVSGCYIDTPGAVAGVQYSLSIVGTGTTGNFVSLDAALIALTL